MEKKKFMIYNFILYVFYFEAFCKVFTKVTSPKVTSPVLHELFRGFPWTPFTTRTPLRLDIKALSVSRKMKYFGLRKRESLPPKRAVITRKGARAGKWRMQWRGNIATIMKTSESNYFCTSYSLLNIRLSMHICMRWMYVGIQNISLGNNSVID